MKYNIVDAKNGRKLVEIEGSAIILDGFEDFNFFHHQTYTRDIPSAFSGTESISECITGGLIADGDTLDEAITNALKNLNSVGSEKFKKMIADQLAITGKPANSI